MLNVNLNGHLKGLLRASGSRYSFSFGLRSKLKPFAAIIHPKANTQSFVSKQGSGVAEAGGFYEMQ